MTDRDWGFLLLDKPEGLTSHTAANRAARALGFSKTGHAGTLDPMATGLMLVGLGRATRLLEFLVGCDKTYRAKIRLGVETTTLDREGEVVRSEESREVTPEELNAAFSTFTGRITQLPPMHSAIKVGGVPLYRKARRGEEVDVPLREVTIDSIALVEYSHPLITVDVECSSGTYIRSLARDLGAALGTVASLWGLRRTRCGPFAVEDAATFDALTPAAIRDPTLMVYGLPSVTLTEGQTGALIHGRTVEPDTLLGEMANIAVFGEAGGLAAVCEVKDGFLVPRKVFLDPPQPVVA